jgi:hypothetical protein
MCSFTPKLVKCSNLSRVLLISISLEELLFVDRKKRGKLQVAMTIKIEVKYFNLGLIFQVFQRIFIKGKFGYLLRKLQLANRENILHLTYT